jgi:hypothetical protein
MTATDDGREDINAYREVLQREKAKTYFQLLLRTTSIHNHLDVTHPHSYLGRIERERMVVSMKPCLIIP